MKCTVHDLEVLGSNLSQVKLGVNSTYVQVIFEPKIHIHIHALQYEIRKTKSLVLTLKLPGPYAGMGGSLTITVA